MVHAVTVDPAPPPAGRKLFVACAEDVHDWGDWVAWQLATVYQVEYPAWDWRAGQHQTRRLDKALKDNDAVVMLLSPKLFAASESSQASWFDFFSSRAIITLRVAPVVLPPLLENRVIEDLHTVDEATASKLLLGAVGGDRAVPLAPPRFPGPGEPAPGPVRESEQDRPPPFPGQRTGSATAGSGPTAQRFASRHRQPARRPVDTTLAALTRLVVGLRRVLPGVALAVAAAFLAVVRPLIRPRTGPPSRFRPWFLRAGVVLVAALAHVTTVASDPPDLTCRPPTLARMLVTGLDPAIGDYLGRAYASTTRDARGCARYAISVGTATEEQAETALRSGWARVAGDGTGASGEPDVDPLRDLGPAPDLWLRGRSRASTPKPITEGAFGTTTVIAQSPVVLALPRFPADLGDRRDGAFTWPELLAESLASTGGTSPWSILRPDPLVSLAGLLVTAQWYRVGEVGMAEGLDRRGDVERPTAQALDAGQFPVGDETSLLRRHGELSEGGDPALRGFVVTEQSMVRFNRGGATGAPCAPDSSATATDTTPPALQAVYPRQTPVLEVVAQHVTWPDRIRQTPVRQRIAAQMLTWLRDRSAGALQDCGLRQGDGRSPVVGAAAATIGVRPEWPFTQIVDSGLTEADAALTRRWLQEARLPVRVLVALDASGSMNRVVDIGPEGARSRFTLAVAAVTRTVTRMGAGDELGLSVFADPGGYQPVVPIAVRSDGLSQRIDAADNRIEPNGNTPLYDAIRRGATDLTKTPRPGAGARGTPAGETLAVLVVVTDGEDTSGSALPTAAQLGPVRLLVFSVAEDGCRLLRTFAQHSGGDCVSLPPAQLQQAVDAALGRVW